MYDYDRMPCFCFLLKEIQDCILIKLILNTKRPKLKTETKKKLIFIHWRVLEKYIFVFFFFQGSN
jgi:hypothetical protein